MRRAVFTIIILMVWVLAVNAQEPLEGAAPTKDFLLGKYHFQENEEFVQIEQKYTTLANPNNYIQKRTYEAFKKMWEAARADGIELVVTSATRNFWVQRYIWEEKWKRSKVNEGPHRAREILHYNSMCGTSRHHWGTELDFNTPKFEFWNSPQGQKTYEWLCKNAHKYGFYQPYTKKGAGRSNGYEEEVWHWSYYPLANIYIQQYKWKIKEKDLKDFLGEEYVSDLKIIEHYVLGVATPPEV